MTEPELVRLLDVARRRPLLDALTVRTGKRKGEAFANVRPEVRERLEALGRERALIYKALVLTGLRKNELATLTVAQLRLDASLPHVELDAADEKNREGNGVMIRADLAHDLRHWLVDKLKALQADARHRGEPIPARLPGGYHRLRGAGRSGADLRPRPEARRHPQAGRAGPHPRRACTQDDLRHAVEPRWGAVADGPGRHAAFRPEPDGERLHRPEALGRGRGPRRIAQPPPRPWTGRRSRAGPSNGDRGLRSILRCTARCTDP